MHSSDKQPQRPHILYRIGLFLLVTYLGWTIYLLIMSGHLLVTAKDKMLSHLPEGEKIVKMVHEFRQSQGCWPTTLAEAMTDVSDPLPYSDWHYMRDQTGGSRAPVLFRFGPARISLRYEFADDPSLGKWISYSSGRSTIVRLPDD